jgi:hypothetical protein
MVNFLGWWMQGHSSPHGFTICSNSSFGFLKPVNPNGARDKEILMSHPSNNLLALIDLFMGLETI